MSERSEQQELPTIKTARLNDSSSSFLVSSSTDQRPRTAAETIENADALDTAPEYENPYDFNFSKPEERRLIWRHLAGFFIMLICTVGIPLGLYYGLRGPLGTLWALIISGIPALLHVAYVAIKSRRVDVLGVLIVFAFIVSGVISIVTGDVRAAILRDSAVTATISLLFFITLIPIRNKWIRNFPLTYLMACQIFYDAMPDYHWYDAQGVRHQMPLSDFLWNHISQVRTGNRLITFGWFFFLMAEFVIRVVMVEATSLTAEEIINYGNIVVGVVTGVMVAITVMISQWVHKGTIIWVKENDHTREFASPPPVI